MPAGSVQPGHGSDQKGEAELPAKVKQFMLENGIDATNFEGEFQKHDGHDANAC